jgi:hypothetical protein
MVMVFGGVSGASRACQDFSNTPVHRLRSTQGTHGAVFRAKVAPHLAYRSFSNSIDIKTMGEWASQSADTRWMNLRNSLRVKDLSMLCSNSRDAVTCTHVDSALVADDSYRTALRLW